MPEQLKLDTAITAVRAAARASRIVQQDLVHALSIDKRDKSPVTVADYAAQAIVCALLKQDFPAIPIVAEEGSAELRRKENSRLLLSVTGHVAGQLGPDTSTDDVLAYIDHGGAKATKKAFWTLDPVDGTKGFLRGGQYAIALALIEKGEVTLGVLGCPNLQINQQTGALFAASRGKPARMYELFNEAGPGKSIGTSSVSSTSQVRFCESVEPGHSNQDVASKIAKILGIKQAPCRIDSQCKYAVVARGDAEVYLRLPVDASYKEKIWDHAAGKIIVESAGGKVTDMHGKPLDFSCGKFLKNNSGIIATSPLIHSAVQAAADKACNR